jgi:hypothetical protein
LKRAARLDLAVLRCTHRIRLDAFVATVTIRHDQGAFQMNESIFRQVLFVAALISASAVALPASAVDKPGGTQMAPVATKKMSPTKMSTQDCDGLGGVLVAAVGICESGQLCKLTGENQKDHAVCITKK